MNEIRKKRIFHTVMITSLAPGILNTLWFFGIISNGLLKMCLLVNFIWYMIPMIWLYSAFVQKEVLFLSYISRQPKELFQNPEKLGLYATRNFYVTYSDWTEEKDVSLGVWHVLPNYVAKKFSRELGMSKREEESAITKRYGDKYEQSVEEIEDRIKNEFREITQNNAGDFYERMLNVPGARIVLYMHGATGSRAKLHRVSLYQMLRELGFHVIVFDYRGYGDSFPTSISLNEAGVVHDGIAVDNYIIGITKNPVLVWGHSLSTGVSCHLLAEIKKLEFFGPRALVLESPFNNIRDAVTYHPFTIPFRFLPWFSCTVIRGIGNFSQFKSDQHIAEFPQPVLILHAEDDQVVPYKLGYKLYLKALYKRPSNWGQVEFIKFKAERGLGHTLIESAPELPDIINSFFDKYENKRFENKIY